MTPPRFMLIAGETSGDMLAAELVKALRVKLKEVQLRPTADAQPLHTNLAAEFFGAGGPRLAAEGVDLAFDMTQHSVIGLWEVLQNYRKFKRLFHQLLHLAIERQPDAILCVDFSGFNRRFAHAVKEHVRAHLGPFYNWNPKIIQYVSPQVWASRPGRANQMARDIDLLLTIFPFEKEWYAKRTPDLRVEFVGHPMLDRYAGAERVTCGDSSPLSPAGDSSPTAVRQVAPQESADKSAHSKAPLVVLLPGSRVSELQRHLPVMLGALDQIRSSFAGLRARMVLPNDGLARLARGFSLPSNIEIQAGHLAEALSHATLALASTGTVTMECAYFGVPTVAFYKTSWSTYQIGKRILEVKYLAMPNLLAGEEIFPEFIQHDATPEHISRAALELLADNARRARVRARMAEIIATLGGPGASARAAEALVKITHSRA